MSSSKMAQSERRDCGCIPAFEIVTRLGNRYSLVHYFAMTAIWVKKLTYFAVDTGTTNTTVWLMKDSRILRESKHPVGVRQTSIRGNRELLESTLRGTFRSLSRRAPSPPRFVLAAGMLTSQLGLLEVPHVNYQRWHTAMSFGVRRLRLWDFRRMRSREFTERPGCSCTWGRIPKQSRWMPGVELCDRPVRSLGKHCTP